MHLVNIIDMCETRASVYTTNDKSIRVQIEMVPYLVSEHVQTSETRATVCPCATEFKREETEDAIGYHEELRTALYRQVHQSLRTAHKMRNTQPEQAAMVGRIAAAAMEFIDAEKYGFSGEVVIMAKFGFSGEGVDMWKYFILGKGWKVGKVGF